MMMKFRQLIRLARQFRLQSGQIQHRLLLYWFSMLLVLLGLLMLLLTVTGTLSTSEKKLSTELSRQEISFLASLDTQMDSLESSAIALSENAAVIIDETLGIRSISTLNDAPDQLLKLETALFPLVSNTLDSGPCSGAFIVLNATTNTTVPDAEKSRAGLYVRYANLSTTRSAQQDKFYFRGIADVARSRSMEMHNRWDLEFDISLLPGYGQLVNHASGRLADNCLWSASIRLPGTWENVIFLCVPIISKNGDIRGVCGMEISDLYFRLAYPAAESDFGSITAVLAPVSGDKADMSKGLTCGVDDSSMVGDGKLDIKEGSSYNRYTAGSSGSDPENGSNFLGRHHILDCKTSEGSPLAALTLISEESFDAARLQDRLRWTSFSLLYLILVTALSLYLSRRFVRPIASRMGTLTEEVRTLAENNETAQKEIARLAYSRKTEIDPYNYQQFLDGIKTLTPKERKIFEYYVSGMTLQEILAAEGIKESTLRYHNRNLYSKLGVNSLKQMLRFAALMKQDGHENE